MNEPEPIEAQVVPMPQNRALVQQSGPTIADLEHNFALAVKQRELLSNYIKQQLQTGKHFYQRGQDKPSLTKEGAEIILLAHGMKADYQIESGPAEPPPDDKPYQLTVKCILRRTGEPNSFLGSGIGSAGSHKRLRDGKYIMRQPDRYLCHNATLKMAQKSAKISATIDTTAASEFFTQDMEDAPPQDNPPEAPRNVRKPSLPPKPVPPVKTPPAASTKPKKGNADELRVWLKGYCEKFIAMAKGETKWAWWAYAVESGWILPTERLEAARPEEVFKIDWSKTPAANTPNVRDQYTHHIAAISKLYDGTAEREECAITAEEYKAKFAAVYAEEATELEDFPDEPQTNSCPHCRHTTVHPSEDYDTIAVCETCGWQWDVDTRQPWEEHKWASIICPIPPKGMTKKEYDKSPMTLGQIMRTDSKRFYGLVMNNQEANERIGKDGKTYQPSAADVRFSEACKAAVEHMNARMRTHHENQAGHQT